MLARAARSLVRSATVPPRQLAPAAMSAPAPAPAKRALSTSPPPPPPAAPQAAADHPDSKRVKLTVEDPVSVPPVLVETPAAPAPAGDSATAAPPRPPKPTHHHPKQPRKPRQRKGKPPKPGGAEEAGAFDVVALLGEERVAELTRLQQDEGRDWVAEAVREWGQGKEGKDLEVQVVGWTDHGASISPRPRRRRAASSLGPSRATQATASPSSRPRAPTSRPDSSRSPSLSRASASASTSTATSPTTSCRTPTSSTSSSRARAASPTSRSSPGASSTPTTRPSSTPSAPSSATASSASTLASAPGARCVARSLGPPQLDLVCPFV